MLQKNQICRAEFTGYTSEGLGVCHVDGMAVFVPRAVEGETCDVKILKVGKSVAYGKIEQRLTTSPHRAEPACPYFGACGGCAFQHLDYEEETRLKAQRVRDALTRIGGIDPGALPILAAAETESYRNKAQFPVGVVGGAPEAGFFRARSHTVIPIERCRIQRPEADAARACVVWWMKKFGIPAYDESSCAGLVRHIYVRCGTKTGETLVCIVANGEKLPHSAELTERLRQNVPGLRGVVLGVNKKQGNAVLGDRFLTLWGDGVIEDVLCGLRFRLSPRSFYQVNRDQAERLYEKAMELAELTERDTALDLYCGTGTITLCMARRAGSVLGVEVIPAAIADAEENARRNGIENARFLCADAGQAAAQLAADGIRPDVILVDPPRKGLEESVIEAMAAMAPQRIVYVSCDPATLARDLRLLCARGYEYKTACAVDLFPRCAHVETVVRIERRKEGE